MSKLRNIAKPSVTHFMDPLAFLNELFRNAKAEIETYSYLQFSEDLGFSRSNVIHLVLRGKRPLTDKAGEKIALALEWKGSTRRYWLNLVSYHGSTDSNKRDELMQEMLEIKTREVSLSQGLLQQLEFFTEWYHSVIYELAFTSEFSTDPKILSATLVPRIRPEQARYSLELLQNMQLLVADGNRLLPTQTRVSTGDEIASMAIMRYHQSMIDLGKGALSSVAGELRDISSISFACSPEQIPLLKREISSFRKKLLDLTDAGPTKEVVYQLNFQLFPLTRKKGSAS